MKLRFRLVLLAFAALAAASLAPGALAAAKLRVLHAAPDVPAVTVYVNGQAAVPSLGTLAATEYLDLPAGEYRIAVALQGQPESAAALRATVTLADNRRYTGLARGLISRGTAELALQEDGTTAPFGSSSLRVWHLSPDAPNVDVYVDGRRVLANVPYRGVSGYLPVPAGGRNVEIRAAGGTTAVFRAAIDLQRGRSYTAAAVGSVGGTGAAFTVRLLEDAQSGARVRVLHAIPDVPAVSVFVNGQRVVPGLAPHRATGYLALPEGRYRVAVALRGQPESRAVLRTTLVVQNATRYTAVARGLAVRRTAQLALQRDAATPPAAANRGSLRVWHLSPDAPRVDVWVNGRRVLSGVPYRAASGYLELAPARYAVQVRVAGTRTVVWRGTVRVFAGRATTAAALGAVQARGARFTVRTFADAH